MFRNCFNLNFVVLRALTDILRRDITLESTHIRKVLITCFVIPFGELVWIRISKKNKALSEYTLHQQNSFWLRFTLLYLSLTHTHTHTHTKPSQTTAQQLPQGQCLIQIVL